MCLQMSPVRTRFAHKARPELQHPFLEPAGDVGKADPAPKS